ncbi:MAG: rhomboid family intramembrane serine protease [Spirochaetaceae bacterium]|nr:rhomboid family intramembrane serine protease [Spirochaetaceae bacterium]
MNFIRKPFRYTYSNAALILICINVLVFIMQYIFNTYYIYKLFALNPLQVIYGKMFWQFITYMFVHGSISHILFNMLALFLFGTALERYIGSKEFVLYYMITGIFAGLISFCIYVLSGTNPFLMGASGALFAVQLAYAAYFPNSYIYFWGILPLRAPVMVIVFTAIELFSGIFGAVDGISHTTHLFGFLAGVMYFFIRWQRNPFKMMFGRRY